MLCIAGQTAGPIGLKFFVDTHGWPGVLYAKKMFCFFHNIFFLIYFFSNFFFKFFSRATPGPLASTK